VLQARERALIFYPFVVFTFGLAIESIKELRGVSAMEFELEKKRKKDMSLS
jgi:hypothetical protein